MATRGYVPNNTAFRAFRCPRDNTIAACFRSIRNTRILIQKHGHCTAAFSSAISATSKPLLVQTARKQVSSWLSSFRRRTSFGSRPARNSPFRTLSTSSDTAGAENLDTLAHLTPDELESSSYIDPFFPSRVPEKDPWYEEALERDGDHAKSQNHTARAVAADVLPKLSYLSTSNLKPVDIKLLVPPYIPYGQINLSDEKLERFRFEPHRLTAKRSNGVSDDRFRYLYNHIFALQESYDQSVALQVASMVFNDYVRTAQESDWELVKQLYLSLCYRCYAADLRIIRNALVKSMLQEHPPRLEAVTLFFETLETDSEPSDKHIRSYLIGFCEDNGDLQLQLAELHKILKGAKQISQPLTTSVILPIVRSVMAADDVEGAHRLVRQLSQQYDLEANFGLLNEVVKGYASQHNWSAIDELLAELHREGFSRKKPMAFAALARTTVQFFDVFHQPERTFDFCTYLMQNHGLIPTASLSVTVLKNFVATKRYDLIHKWVQMRQDRFPSSLSSIRSPLAAYNINAAWVEATASPIDVWLTCRALAHGSLHNPFSDEFRLITNTYLLDWLHKRFEWYLSRTNIEKHSINFQRFVDLQSAYSFALRLVEVIKRKRAGGTSMSLVADGFARHVVAAQRTDALVNDFRDYVQQHGPIFVPDLNPADLSYYQIRENRVIKRPRYVDLASLPSSILTKSGKHLVEAVTGYFEKETSTFHRPRSRSDFLVDIIRRLKQDQRHLDCLALVKHMRSHGHPAPPSVTHDLLEIWIQIAIELHDASLLQEALWAAIDADPSFVMSDNFFLLVRIAESEVKRDIEGNFRKQRPEDGMELWYLVSRLYRRKWQGLGCPEVEEIRDPYLKKWRQGMVELGSEDREAEYQLHPRDFVERRKES